MRPWESYLVYSSLLALAWPATWSVGIAALTLFLHLALERPRWQFVLVYTTVALLGYAVMQPGTASWWFRASQLAGMGVVMASSAVACLVPVSQLPNASGPFAPHGVGRRRVQVTYPDQPKDAQDPEAFRKGLGQRFMLRVYYPAAAAEKPRASLAYMSRLGTRGFAWFMHLPSVVLSHLGLTDSPEPVFDGAPVRSDEAMPADGWPIVMFSHGLGGTPDCYFLLISELVSQGYIVAAVEHNDGSAAVAHFPDGTVNWYRRPSKRQLRDIEEELRNGQLKIRVHELLTALDALYPEPRSSAGMSEPLDDVREHIDFNRVAFVGHSFGGATATQAAARYEGDALLKAVVNLDGWMKPLCPDVKAGGALPVPIMVQQSEQFLKWSENYEQMEIMHRGNQERNILSVFGTLQSSGHQNFCDFGVLTTFVLRKLKQAGDMCPRKCHRLINAYAVAFLDTHVRPDRVREQAHKLGTTQKLLAQGVENGAQQMLSALAALHMRRGDDRGGAQGEVLSAEDAGLLWH